VRARLTSEDGFGLIELLVAMVILNVALLALVAAFGSGAVGVARGAKVGTGAALADEQMEVYRAMLYDPIGLDTSAAPTTGSYVTDSACVSGGATTCSNAGPTGGYSCTATAGATSVSLLNSITIPASGYLTAYTINPCTPRRTMTGPDGTSYIVDTYIKAIAATTGANSQRATKQVTVVVRDNSGSRTNGITLARETSVFDCSTGQIPNSAPC
jgi:type II secretory pathway pseudopilin PulG